MEMQLLCGYPDTPDKNLNHAMFRLPNGLKVRPIQICGGTPGKAATVTAFADVHLNFCDETDREEANPSILSTREHRKWMADGAAVPALRNAMDLAADSDQTVLIGDVLDYLSHGAIRLMQKEILDRDPSVCMAIGGHDLIRVMQGKVPDPTSLASRYEVLRAVWPNDLHYHSRYLRNAAGQKKARLVLLDNHTDQYGADLLAPFREDLALCRKEGLPLLLFQHDPIYTNQGETAAADWFYEPGDVSEMPWNLWENGAGGKHSTEETKALYRLIVENGDVIRGIFCGHIHNHCYTEVLASDPMGNPASIPQYIVTANAYHQGCVLQITVE